MYFLIQRLRSTTRLQKASASTWEELEAQIKGTVVDCFRSDTLTNRDFENLYESMVKRELRANSRR